MTWAAIMCMIHAGMCPLPPAGAVLMDPPPVYVLWWREASECANRGGDFRRVDWYSVGTGPAFPCPWGACFGVWRRSHEIYIAGGRVLDSSTVKHEILHELGFVHTSSVFRRCA